jgi:DNA polymerase alpha subunit B
LLSSSAPSLISTYPVFPNCVEKPYRFMFEKLMDKAAVLDMRIDEMSEKLVRKHKLLASSEEEATKGRGLP